MNKDFDTEIVGLGNNITGYPGAFTPKVDMILRDILKLHRPCSVLHLFSGVSTIGQERIDIERPEATKRVDVLDFIDKDNRDWDFVILDPPYEIKRKAKLQVYGRASSVAADVELHRKIEEYFRNHAENILWLDMCAPLPKGFKRLKLWFLFPGGYHTIRILSWLVRDRGQGNLL